MQPMVPLPVAVTSTFMTFVATILFFAIAGPLAIMFGAGQSLGQRGNVLGLTLYDLFLGSLGIIAGILEFVPYFGPIISAVPAMAMAFLDGPEKALWVALAYLAIQQIEGNIMMPLLMKEGLDLPPVLTILSQAALSLVFGFVGLLFAVPLLGAVMVPIKLLYVQDVVGDDVPLPGEAIHLPGPSYLPAIVAAGTTIALVGLVLNWVLFGIGMAITIVAILRWVGQTRADIADLPLEHEH